MKIALPYWHERVSPVLDVAVRFLLITLEQGIETAREEMLLDETGPLGRAGQFSCLGVDVVICGAVSRPLESALRSEGILVVAYTCGQVEDVLEAFVDGRLDEDTYVMPGCLERRRDPIAGGGMLE